uniref:Argininosuccinate lyase n=1 Tax=Anthurium amnicola TaxID=1678845 RepID=A0A1D1XY48_9ARAE
MLDVEGFRHGGSRSRRREKLRRSACGERQSGEPDLGGHRGATGEGARFVSVDGARGEGNGQIRQQANVSMLASDCSTKNPIQHNMVAFELMHGSSKKANGTSIKMLIDQEMSKGMQSRRYSSNVIAKLMGLDTLPAQQPGYMQKESVSCFLKGSSEGFLEKHLPNGEEFKDVFEVLETQISEESGNLSVQKRLRKSRRRHKEMDFERQMFMSAKRLSTDEKLQSSKQFSEALEVLESNKDLFLKLLQEPSSLFIKHLEEYRSASPTPEASHIMILKSSNATECNNSEKCWKSERKTERNSHIKKKSVNKFESDFVNHCIKEHNVSLSKKMSKYKFEGKADAGSLPTHIVVLKPRLENVQETIYQENSSLGDFGYRRRRESRMTGARDLFYEMGERKKLSDDVVVTNRARSSREIAKEISKHMMHTIDGSVKSFGSGRSVCHRHKNSCQVQGTSTFMDFQTLSQTPDQLHNSYTSSYSTESSVSREARKRLSERWKMAHKFQDVGVSGQGSSTLGEMLALSDREKPDAYLSSLSWQESSHHKMSGKEVVARCGSLGISSRDAWKDEFLSSSLKSKSLPQSSFFYGGTHSTSDNDISMLKDVENLESRKSFEGSLLNQRLSSPDNNLKNYLSSSHHSNHVGDENEHHLSEANVGQDEFQYGLDIKRLSEKLALSEPDVGNNSDASYPVDQVLVVCDEGTDVPCIADEQQLPHSLVSTPPVDDEHPIVCDEKENVKKGTTSNGPQTESHPGVTGEVCSPTVTMAEHPSPVSVLEPPEENESSECFEMVNASIQELRMQIQLLKSESRNTYAVSSVIPYDGDAGGECDGVFQAGGIQVTFNAEEHMEFCYLRNILAESGFYDADWNMLFCACFSPEPLISPDVFEEVETMYDDDTWQRTERKLLFDLMNSVLADILTRNVDPRPWIKPRRIGFTGCNKHLADDLWQSLVRLRMDGGGDPSGEGTLDLRWLDLRDDIDAVGIEIERMVNNDLLEELVSEIMMPKGSPSMDSSVYTCRHCGRNNVLSESVPQDGISRSQPAVL